MEGTTTFRLLPCVPVRCGARAPTTLGERISGVKNKTSQVKLEQEMSVRPWLEVPRRHAVLPVLRVAGAAVQPMRYSVFGWWLSAEPVPEEPGAQVDGKRKGVE